MGDKWQHDMYQNEFNGGQVRTPGRSNAASKLLISNLDYGVSDDDISVSCTIVWVRGRFEILHVIVYN